METKFNFNSQICTNKIQSIHLLALGLKKETSDMTIHIKYDGSWYVTADPFYEWEDDMNTLPSLEDTEQILPAWSLHRLIEIVSYTQYPYYVISKELPIYDALCERIVWLIKEGKFPKEYLNGTIKD